MNHIKRLYIGFMGDAVGQTCGTGKIQFFAI